VGVPCDAADATQQGWAFDAEAGHITRGGLCLSAREWGIPLNMYACGNATTHQNFTYKGTHFQTHAPANGKGDYPAYLEVAMALYPIVTSQYSSTALYQVPYHTCIQSLFF
jgi:hypothetical protein